MNWLSNERIVYITSHKELYSSNENEEHNVYAKYCQKSTDFNIVPQTFPKMYKDKKKKPCQLL